MPCVLWLALKPKYRVTRRWNSVQKDRSKLPRTPPLHWEISGKNLALNSQSSIVELYIYIYTICSLFPFWQSILDVVRLEHFCHTFPKIPALPGWRRLLIRLFGMRKLCRYSGFSNLGDSANLGCHRLSCLQEGQPLICKRLGRSRALSLGLAPPPRGSCHRFPVNAKCFAEMIGPGCVPRSIWRPAAFHTSWLALKVP